MLELIKAGGWVMLPILLLAVLALAIILERFWTLRRREVLPPGLGEEVREWARGRSTLDPKHIDVLRGNSPLGELLAAGLDVRHRPRDIIKERIEDVGRHVAHRLERFLNALGTIASAAPLLGLLGTLIGMIEIFGATGGANGVGADPTALAHGISVALYNTAFGLIVAIPALICHRHFRTRIDGYTMAMEEAGERMLQHLMRLPGKRNGA